MYLENTNIMSIKQSRIQISDVNGKDWGDRPINQLNWDKYNHIYMIIIDWYSDGGQSMHMFLHTDGKYYNQHRNLIGIIIT